MRVEWKTGRRNQIRVRPGLGARHFSWSALAAILFFFATVATRMPIAPLRAADPKRGPAFDGTSRKRKADRKGAPGLQFLATTHTDEANHARDRHGNSRLHGLPRRKCHRFASRRVRRPVRPSTIKPKKRQSASASRAIPQLANRSSNPERAFTQWLKESPEYVRFVNPGDLRIAGRDGAVARGCPHLGSPQRFNQHDDDRRFCCGGAALYNKRRIPPQGHAIRRKLRARRAAPQTVRNDSAGRLWKKFARKAFLGGGSTPLERWEISQPGNVLRVFERGRRTEGRSGRAKYVLMMQANLTTSSARVDSVRSFAPIPCFLGFAEDAPA